MASRRKVGEGLIFLSPADFADDADNDSASSAKSAGDSLFLPPVCQIPTIYFPAKSGNSTFARFLLEKAIATAFYLPSLIFFLSKSTL
jgi:hypothetical protein